MAGLGSGVASGMSSGISSGKTGNGSGYAVSGSGYSDVVELEEGRLGNDLRHREVELIVRAIREEPSRKEAAERLGISPRTLRYKVAKLRDDGIDVEAMI